MGKFVHSVRSNRQGFSLVELTIAIAVLAFAFIAIFGLLPAGLNTFHRSMDTSVGSQIMQRIITEAQQTDFDILVGSNREPFLAEPTPRYFDEQGNEVSSPDLAIYQVNMRITPITATPRTGAAPVESGNVHLATLTVQMASKRGPGSLPVDGDSLLWADRGNTVSTSSALISRNQ